MVQRERQSEGQHQRRIGAPRSELSSPSAKCVRVLQSYAIKCLCTLLGEVWWQHANQKLIRGHTEHMRSSNNAC